MRPFRHLRPAGAPVPATPAPPPHGGHPAGAGTTPVRIVVAEHPGAGTAGLAALLAGDPALDVVGRAVDGATVLELAARLQPRVAVVADELPGLCGLDVAHRLSHDPTTAGVAVLVVSADGDPGLLSSAMGAGAAGTALLHAGPERLTAEILRHAAA